MVYHTTAGVGSMPDHAESNASADALVDVEEPLLRNSSDDLTGDFAEKEGHGQHRCDANVSTFMLSHSWVAMLAFCHRAEFKLTQYRLLDTAAVPHSADNMPFHTSCGAMIELARGVR